MKNSQLDLTRLALFGLFAMLLAGCSGKQSQPEKSETGSRAAMNPEQKLIVLSEEEAQRAGIRVQNLELRDKAEQIAVTATIQPNRDRLAHVAPRMSGRIVRVSANLGEKVKPGQALAMLDSMELGNARLAYLQARSDASVARAAFDRARKLAADDIIPEKVLLQARAEQEKAHAALLTATEKLRMMGIPNPEKISGSTFQVMAPFSGTVIEKKAVLGDLASADQSLFTVADLSVLWIEANLYEKDLAKVKPGAQASITVSAYPGEVFQGRLTYISSVMDKESRTVRARVEVPNPEGRLKPEMFATAAIHTGSSAKALLLPEDEVLLVQGTPTVFVAGKGGFEARAVEVGERFDGVIVIKSGIQAGESVVTGGAYALKARLLKSQIGDAD